MIINNNGGGQNTVENILHELQGNVLKLNEAFFASTAIYYLTWF